MKRSDYLKQAFSLILGLIGISSVYAKNTGSFNTTITFMSQSRALAVFVPGNYDSTQKYRLMICLHGVGDNVNNYRNALVGNGWPINIPNTIFICPETYGVNYPDYFTPTGDEAVIQACIDYARSNYNIDASDIILQGFSIGGRDALRYGLDHPKQFKGLLLNTPAVQGVKEALNGHPKVFAFNYANASKIPIYITHGEADAQYEGPVDSTFRQLVLNDGKTWYFQFPALGHAIPAISLIKNFIPFFNNPSTAGHNLDIQDVVVARRTCNASVPAEVLIRNTGSETINSVTFQYSINSTPQSYTWTGTLTPFQHALVSLPPLSAVNGNQTLDVKVKYLNGSISDSDSVFSKNEKAASFQYVNKGEALPLLQTFNGPTVPPVNWLEVPQGEYWTPWFIDSSVHEKGGFASMGAANMILIFDNAGRREGIMTPVLDLTSTTNPGLKFDVAYNYQHYTASVLGIDSTFADTLEILISTDCGDTWHSLYKKGGKQLATFHDPILNPTTIASVLISPADSNWRIEEINLGAYAGATQAVIKFDYISGLGGCIFIDNLALSTYLGIKQESKIPALQIFPNPASDKVNIVAGEDNITRIEVVEISGKTVMSIPSETGVGATISVNTSALPKGMYLFRVFTNNGVNTSKVLLN